MTSVVQDVHHSILERESKDQLARASCGLFPLSWRSRRLAIRFVENPYFDSFMMVVIIANAIMLALYDPVNLQHPMNSAIHSTEVFFLVVYTVEMLLKMYAYGIYWEAKKSTYFRNAWDTLDFIVVVIGWVTFGVDAFGTSSSFFSTLRLLRILKLLKNMKSFPALSWVTKALLRAVPQLLSGGALFLVLSFVAAIVGMTFFRGKLRQRCVYVDNPTVVVPEDLANDRFCAMDNEPSGRHCPYINSTCSVVDFNPNNNITSFDDIWSTAIILFQIITMEGWVDVMYAISDTNGVASQLYFVLVVLLGGVFIINVLLAVLAVNITVQRELDQNANETEADLKAIEQSLLERRLLSEKFGAEDLSKQNMFRRFLRRNRISLKDSMEMRLMLSRERMKDSSGYTLVSEPEYKRLAEKHSTLYSEWKKHVVPVLDPCERVASAKREQQTRDERREWERRAGALSGKKLARPDVAQFLKQSRQHEAVTPPFIYDEVRAIEAEARLRMLKAAEAKRNRLQKLDSFLDRLWSGFLQKIKAIQDQPFAGEREDSSRIQQWCFKLVGHPWFDKYLMNLCIVVNVLVLSVVHYNQPPWVTEMLYVGDILFASIFVAELVLKMIALGPSKYWTDSWLAFDGTIALVSLLQFANSGGAYVAAFRSIRLFRLIRLLVRMRSMKRILVAIWKTMLVVIPFLLLLMLFLFVATIMGLQLFGGILEIEPSEYDCSPSYINYPHCPPRSHFDSFFFAFITTFQIVTKDNWNQVMYNVVSASSYWAFLYFFGVITIGTLVVLNLFLGVLIDSFLRVTEEKKRRDMMESQLDLFSQDGSTSHKKPAKRLAQSNAEKTAENSPKLFRLRFKSSAPKKVGFALSPESNPVEAQLALKEHVQQQKRVQYRRRNWRFENHPSYKYSTWFGLIKGTNPIRLSLGNLICSPLYKWFVIGVVIVSSVSVCFESAYIPPDIRNSLEVINIFVAVVFFTEALLKMFCFGVYGHPGSYVRQPWNLLDLALVAVLVLSLVTSGLGWERLAHMFRAFYPLRIIRHVDGLRIAIKSVGGAVLPVVEVGIFICLFFLAGAIFGTLLFQGSLYACYEGPSTAFPRIPQNELCFPVRDQYSNPNRECLPQNHCNASHWLNPTVQPGGGVSVNFDSVPRSLLVLFELSALENWFVPMFAAMDSTQIGWNFMRESSRYTALFFVFFVLFFNVLLVQLFVAVVVDSFRQSEREAEAKAFLTPRQYEWIRMQRKAVELPFQSREPPPRDEPFKSIHSIVVSKIFKRFVVLTTLLNTAVLLSIHTDPSPDYLVFFTAIDYFTGAVYLLEAAMKLAAFGAAQYVSRGYNWIDLAVCIATIIGWTVPGAGDVVQFVDAFKIFGVIYYLPRTKHLVSTLTLSAPALLNVASLVFLVFYIYAVIGVAVFSNIRDYPPANGAGFVLLNHYVNFENFGASLMTLFRMATGESWNGIMRDMVNSNNTNIANFAYVYCLSFIVTIQFCLLNLIVAVIMFDISDEIENNAKGKSSNVSVNHLVTYAKVWSDVRYEYERKLIERQANSTEPTTRTSHGTEGRFRDGETGEGKTEDESHDEVKMNERQDLEMSSASFLRKIVLGIHKAVQARSETLHPQIRMPYSELPNLIIRLPPPLGLKGVRNITRGDTLKVIRALQIPVNENGEIHYHTTLSNLIDRVVLGDVINKTLKASIVGPTTAATAEIVPGATRDLMRNLQQASNNPAVNADLLLDRVTEELRELLHLQIPTRSVSYILNLDHEHERDDGYDAASLIATRLLHKAAARFLQRKREQNKQARDQSSRLLSVGSSKRSIASSLAKVESDRNITKGGRADSMVVVSIKQDQPGTTAQPRRPSGADDAIAAIPSDLEKNNQSSASPPLPMVSMSGLNQNDAVENPPKRASLPATLGKSLSTVASAMLHSAIHGAEAAVEKIQGVAMAFGDKAEDLAANATEDSGGGSFSGRMQQDLDRELPKSINDRLGIVSAQVIDADEKDV